jgi:hypothetical protein
MDSSLILTVPLLSSTSSPSKKFQPLVVVRDYRELTMKT